MRLEMNNPEQDKIEVVQEQISKVPSKIGTIKPHKGHTLFEADLANSVIRKATIRKVDADIGPYLNGNKHIEVALNKAVVVQPGCVYISALNIENAKRKLIKQIYATSKKQSSRRAN